MPTTSYRSYTTRRTTSSYGGVPNPSPFSSYPSPYSTYNPVFDKMTNLKSALADKLSQDFRKYVNPDNVGGEMNSIREEPGANGLRTSTEVLYNQRGSVREMESYVMSLREQNDARRTAQDLMSKLNSSIKIMDDRGSEVDAFRALKDAIRLFDSNQNTLKGLPSNRTSYY
ncbi:hypothetical protein ECANGB1_2061 [Enterospora canceri]|uniref:Uncharacterized protein n=1 Tax=Enterospora canceri TaxID=1081671 RepID=A0A1Y1S8R3_9MICR|nr:hypothetical protein ECANGB1_2061 [Enterospora canceri]